MVINNNIDKSSARKKWSHIPYEKKNLPEIGLFFKELYSGTGDYGNMGFFHWKIVENYIKPGIINLIKDGDRIASTTSVTPKLLVYKNEFVNAAEIGDTYTHPDYWRQGMFSLLINQTRKDAEIKGINFIYGTPNKLSLPGYQKKANFDLIRNLYVKSLVFPINISLRISKKSHWILGIIIGSIFSILTFLYFKMKNIFFFIDKSITIKEINQIPNDWSEFWNQAREGYDFIINRNVEATTWRYFSNPNKYKFITIRKNNNLIGYLIYRIISDEKEKIIMIADYLTLPGQAKALYEAVNFTIDRAFQIGVTQVSLWCVKNSPYYKVFKKKGFFARSNIPVICYQNEFAEQVERCTSWHFTLGDSDNI